MWSSSPINQDLREIEDERIAAFCEYIAAVHESCFPERCHLVKMEALFMEEMVRSIDRVPSNNKD